MTDKETIARALAATRRYVLLLDEQHSTTWAKTSSRHLDVCVGDLVTCNRAGEERIASAVEPRKNCIKRSYGRRSKELAANVDLLLIVTAPQPLFNTSFIDRALVAAQSENVRTALIINKADLSDDLEATRPLLKVYRDVVAECVEVSAMQGIGIETLQALLDDPSRDVVVFAGVSGVGKSSLINTLIPDAEQRVQEVSERTGQGRQTTTQAMGHLYRREACEDLCLVDLPGIQNFGLTHLEKTAVRDAFVDFTAQAPKCQFSNCMHLDEPDCAVKAAIASGGLAESRYRSYTEILEEIDRFTDY